MNDKKPHNINENEIKSVAFMTERQSIEHAIEKKIDDVEQKFTNDLNTIMKEEKAYREQQDKELTKLSILLFLLALASLSSTLFLYFTFA